MRMKRALVSAILIAITVSVGHAQSLEQELTTLKDKLTKSLVAKGRKKVAALDFTDLQGRRNELGRYLAEQLTVELVGADGIAVVDRANLKSILDEHKLTEEGLVNPENAKKLGQFSGVDAIIIGNLSVTDTDIVLLVKAISTETAEVVAAGRVKFPKTSEFQQLLDKGILPGGETAVASGSGGTAARSVDTNAIATKEIGCLRITLKNVVPLNEAKSDGSGRRPNDGEIGLITGVTCSFEVTNLDLRKTLQLANNGKPHSKKSVQHIVRRSRLTDSTGHEWTLYEATGLPVVSCGPGSDPTSILRLIQSGTYMTRNELFTNGGEASRSWCGDFISIEPGKTIRVSMTFYDLDDYDHRSRYSTKWFDYFQLVAELVIGTSEPGSKEFKYSLESLVLDKVTMPKAGETQDSKPTR